MSSFCHSTIKQSFELAVAEKMSRSAKSSEEVYVNNTGGLITYRANRSAYDLN